MKQIIANESVSFSADQIKLIEEKYNARYVCETCFKSINGEWINQPFTIFWQDKPHPRGSNYFALYFKQSRPNDDMTLMITDGKPVEEQTIAGYKCEDGTIIYSRYRHDYRSHFGNEFIDGGRDYTRYNGERQNLVTLKVINGYLVVVKLIDDVDARSVPNAQ